MTATLSTHVLDTSRGEPVAGITVTVFRDDERVGQGTTDADGRVRELAAGLERGTYRLVFDLPSPFFKRVALDVELGDGHHHVPLLLSAYGVTTYRGS
jgi:5-hydroxyisourate hydrolase